MGPPRMCVQQARREPEPRGMQAMWGWQAENAGYELHPEFRWASSPWPLPDTLHEARRLPEKGSLILELLFLLLNHTAFLTPCVLLQLERFHPVWQRLQRSKSTVKILPILRAQQDCTGSCFSYPTTQPYAWPGIWFVSLFFWYRGWKPWPWVWLPRTLPLSYNRKWFFTFYF